MEKTSHYQLNQWDKEDRILMEDFNADNLKLDTALAAVASAAASKAEQSALTAEAAARQAADNTLNQAMATKAEQSTLAAGIAQLQAEIAANSAKFIPGSYTGTGTSEVVHFTLGAKPKLLLVASTLFLTSGSWLIGMIAWDGCQLVLTNAGNRGYTTFITFTNDGFDFNFNAYSSVTNGFNRENMTYHYFAIV